MIWIDPGPIPQPLPYAAKEQHKEGEILVPPCFAGVFPMELEPVRLRRKGFRLGLEGRFIPAFGKGYVNAAKYLLTE